MIYILGFLGTANNFDIFQAKFDLFFNIYNYPKAQTFFLYIIILYTRSCLSFSLYFFISVDGNLKWIVFY